jgi:hypothetical protein
MALGLLIGVPLLFVPIALVAINRAQAAFTQLEVDRAMTIITWKSISLSY